MFKSYIKIAFRNLRKNRLISFINLFGLALSMSVGMMVLVILQHELSYDRFHPFPDRTYRVTSHFKQKDGGVFTLASTPLPLYTTVKRDKTQVEDVVNIYPSLNGVAKSDSKELNINGAFTDASFFNVLGFSLQKGNIHTALSEPNSIVITQNTAQRFFGHEDPMGKTIEVGGKGLYNVTGVLNEPPGLSHIDFDAYASFSTVPVLEHTDKIANRLENKDDIGVSYTYVLLRKNITSSSFQQMLNGIVADWTKGSKEGLLSFNLQAITDIRPGNADIYNDIGGGTSWDKLWTEIIVCLVILIAACFNYTNLTIARALTRAKESGIRKIVGAKRHQLFTQYLTESLLQSLLALGISWVLLSFIIKYAPFNDGYEFIPSSWKVNPSYIIYSICFALFTGLLAGIAPAWTLSAFQPLRVLKNLSTARIFGKISLQKTLVVFQYSLSLVIIIFLVTFYRQFAFMGSADPGFKRDNVLVIPLKGTKAAIASQKIAAVSGVQNVTAMSSMFTGHFSGLSTNAWMSDPQQTIKLNTLFTAASFIPAMNLELLAGRNFQSRSDSAKENEIIINTRAMQMLGVTAAGQAIGKSIFVNDSTKLEVIGVIKDFAYENVGKPIDPLCLRNNEAACNFLLVDAGNSDHKAITSRIKAAWSEAAPKTDTEFSWLNEDLERNNSQTATVSLLGYLAFIALSIATLGLLGLVIFSVETRRKEIGIRKVAGASKTQVVRLLSRGYIKLLLIAGAIAVPIGHVMGFLFLQNFASRVDYALFYGMMCFLFLLFIGLVTIISQTYKASLENPVNSLRTE
ncbi:MAG: hypothetical protein DI535_15495 [Citrobacter freundii]|nr:MAG: hypothetical protein DI535_15495 [Citrobacter freundii]